MPGARFQSAPGSQPRGYLGVGLNVSPVLAQAQPGACELSGRVPAAERERPACPTPAMRSILHGFKGEDLESQSRGLPSPQNALCEGSKLKESGSVLPDSVFGDRPRPSTAPVPFTTSAREEGCLRGLPGLAGGSRQEQERVLCRLGVVGVAPVDLYRTQPGTLAT